MNNPYVIVLILSYNGKELLDDSVSSYLTNTYSNFEVVVIDNGSTDGTKEYIEQNYKDAKIVRLDKNRAYSGGFNFGLDYAFNQKNADYVLVTNNDVKADKEVISSTVEVAQNNTKSGFVTGKVYFYNNPDVFQTVGKKGDEVFWRGGHIGRGEKDQGQYELIREIEWCDDIFWLVSKELYNITGGYDTEFQFQAEDFDWQVRAKKAGFKIFYTPFAKIWHKESMTIGKQSAFKSYYDFRNPLIVHMKYRPYKLYKHYFKLKRRALIFITIKNIARLRLSYVFKSWMGFISAVKWGIKNDKFKISYMFK
jgi:GT2 family glycosyltransferase